MQLDSAAVVATVEGGMTVLFAYGIQIIFFHDIPNLMATGGALLILASIMGTGLRKIVDTKCRNVTLRKFLCLQQFEEKDDNVSLQKIVCLKDDSLMTVHI